MAKLNFPLMAFLIAMGFATVMVLIQVRGSVSHSSKTTTLRREAAVPSTVSIKLANELPPMQPRMLLGQKTFQLFKNKTTWDLAQENCTAAGGELATIRDQTEQDQITALMDANYVPAEWSGWPYVYLGARRLAPGSLDWDWVDGTPMRRGTTNIGYSNWKAGEPNTPDSELCLSSFYDVEPKGQWNDLVCFGSGHYICEFFTVK